MRKILASAGSMEKTAGKKHEKRKPEKQKQAPKGKLNKKQRASAGKMARAGKETGKTRIKRRKSKNKKRNKFIFLYFPRKKIDKVI